MRKAKVYIAGPYSQPDPCANTGIAMRLWDRLYGAGYAPFCPHWSHFQHTFLPRPYQDWLDFDKEWVAVCDVLLRMPGASSGADGEVRLARELGIPVVGTFEELLALFPPDRRHGP